ncbi:hydrogenase expression protein HypA [Streptomyces californicus]|uniref:hydrogenase expression protein HypA n=1 Tax=Streptomyces californicus TaxID=67351 RepID=UPI003815F7B4
MAREQDPGSHIAPGAAGATGSQVSVRRAVPMSGAAGDPGDALAPGGRPGRPEEPSGPGGSEAGERGPVNASGETESSGSGAPTAPEARTPAPQTAGADPVRGVGAPAPAASSAASAPAASSAEDVAEGDTATAAARPSSASSEPAAVASSAAPAPGSGGADGATAVAAGAGGGPGARTDEDPPGSRPKKPMLAAAAIAGAVLISVPFLVAGQDDDRKAEKDRTQNAAGTVLDAARPPAPETYTSETPKPSPTPSRKKEEKKKEPVKPSAPQPLKPVVVTPTPTPTPTPSPSKQQQKKAASTKAPAGTAAAALEHLAKSDPQGRHICYRAFVAGQGWQVPVCDGTMTGTTGQGKKITALNISVWNVEGSSANALLHDAGAKSGNAKWAPSWTPVIANGKNVYIGSSKAGAPFMTGFAMNVGKGNVCHTAKMRNGGWGPQYCKSSRPDYMFVGTTDNGNWFEAVKLTV